MTRVWRCWRALAVPVCVLGLAACSNGRGSVDGDGGTGQQQNPPKVTIGGSVAGLAGSGLILQNNGGDNLAVSANGTFSFNTTVDAGAPYNITVLTQPANPSQGCTVGNPSGTATANVTNVSVTCSTGSFSVGGTVSGLGGSGLVLQNNKGDDVGVQSDGGFAFPTKIPSGGGFEVTVLTQPASPAQACSVQNGSGTVVDRDVDNIVITCALRQFTIGGTISNLRGSGLVLQNNGGDRFTPTADGPFTFPTAVLSGSSYSVSVWSPPIRPLQVCQIQNANGIVADANVTNVTINCITIGFGVGGTVSGLESPGLELQSNGEKLAVAANGKFILPSSLPDGMPYDVTISQQPANQVCSVANGRGVLEKGDATGVTVTCR